MAGVGFELKKLFRSKDGYLRNLHGFAVSAAVTQGPMLLNILLLVLMRFLMRQTGAQVMEQEWFLYTVTYATVFSLIFSNTLLLFIDRFVSDCIYKGEEERILPSFFTLLFVLLGVFGLVAIGYIAMIPRDPLYKLAALLQFGELLVIWSEMSYLSAIKQYGKVLIGFMASVVVASLTGFALLRFTAMDRVCAALLGICAGYAVMLLMYFQQMLLYYPHGSFNLFDCLPALDEHKILIAIGFFMAFGVYAHNFVFWLSEARNAIWALGVFCTRYDIPTFFASFTIMPMLILFVVAVETQVYEHYRAYFDAILHGGTLQDIQLARRSLLHVIFRECSHLMEMQLFVTIICATFLGNFLSGLGLDAEQTAIYRILCFGYCLFGMMKCLIILMLYFEDRGGALAGTVLFALLSTALSLLTLRMEPALWGFGFTAAAFAGVLFAAFRIRYFLEHLESKVFLRQPLFAQTQAGFFTRLARRMTRLDDNARGRFYRRHTRKMEKRRQAYERFRNAPETRAEKERGAAAAHPPADGM